MLLFVTVSWGLSFPFIKILLNDISPFLLVFIRFFIAFAIFSFFYRRHIRVTGFGEYKEGLILGALLFAGYAFQTAGLYFTSASKSGFITGTNLILIPFIQYIVLKIRPGLFNTIGALIVLTGLYFLTGAHLGQLNLGDILTIFCAISFAVHIVLLSKYSETKGFTGLAFGQFLAMSFFGLISVLVLERIFFEDIKFSVSATTLGYLLFVSLISTLLSLILMFKYQKFTTPFRAGIIYNLEAVFAAVFAFYLLGEEMNDTQMVAVIVMFTGFIISELAVLFKKETIGDIS